MLRKLLLVLYGLTTIGLMIMGYLFEEPFGSRRVLLLVLCAVYLTLMVAKILYKRGSLFTMAFCFLMSLLLLGIETYSKYAVNYFFHTIYLLLIFFAIIHIKTKYAVALCAFTTVLSFVKFIQLITVAPTFANVALMVFFGSFQVLIVVTGLFLKVYQDETRKTKSLYDALLESHDQLKAYAREIKELSQMEARTMIARDLHDTLGHDLTGLIMQMEMATGYYDDGQLEEGHKLLVESKKSARDSLVKVRKIVETLKSNGETNSIENSVKDLIEGFSEKTGCTIRFSEKGNKPLKPEVNLVLYRVVQESLTNALRHGEATLVYVSFIYQDNQVVFVIEDNGKGCDSVEEGNGIAGMIDRVREIGGDLSYRSNSGFMVKGHIPMVESTDQ